MKSQGLTSKWWVLQIVFFTYCKRYDYLPILYAITYEYYICCGREKLRVLQHVRYPSRFTASGSFVGPASPIPMTAVKVMEVHNVKYLRLKLMKNTKDYKEEHSRLTVQCGDQSIWQDKMFEVNNLKYSRLTKHNIRGWRCKITKADNAKYSRLTTALHTHLYILCPSMKLITLQLTAVYRGGEAGG